MAKAAVGLFALATGWDLFSVGVNAAFTSPLDLRKVGNVKGIQFNGISAGNQAGYASSGVGDVNGDGIDDFIVGTQGIADGQSYVVFGNTDFGTSEFELNTLDGTNGFVLNGMLTQITVSAAGDFNGDGYDDILIGSPYADPSGRGDAGQSYVVFGRSSFPATMALSSLDGNNGVILNGVNVYESSGWDVSGVGDVNGDGFDDILIGAPRATPHGADSGCSYLVFGRAAFVGATFELSSLDGSNGVKFNGIALQDNCGRAVSWAGDFNGDGFADILIGAAAADGPGISDTGQAYVVLGRASFTSGTFELSSLDGSNGVRFNGINAFDYVGISLSGAGDVNGDGFDDIIIGAPTADVNGKVNAGQSYVVFGRARFLISAMELFSLDGGNGFIVNGIAAGDESGRTVAGGGDVNGDGFDDLLILASLADPLGVVDAGQTFVVHGKATFSSGFLELSHTNGENGFGLNGVDASQEYSEFFALSFAGDVNGDGRSDILIGNRWASPNGKATAGALYLAFSASTINRELRSIANGVGGLTMFGHLGGIVSGYSVANAGDFNGDGFDDFIVGAHKDSPLGRPEGGDAAIIFGSHYVTDTMMYSGLDGTNGIRLFGLKDWDRAGYCVSGAGDVNGDGFDDVIVSVPFDDPNGLTDSGAVYVIFGAQSFSKGFYDLDKLDGIKINGNVASNAFGGFSSGAGDINGDGFDDVIVGSAVADPGGRVDAGSSYVIFGRATFANKVIELSSLDGSNGFTINGADASDMSGYCVSGAGDFNGDGFDDIIIGAPLGDPNGALDAGEAYILFGKAHFSSNTIELGGVDGTNGIILQGVFTTDQFGLSVSGAGDVNGDGYDDVVVGSRNSDLGGTDSGTSYIFFGKSTFTSNLLRASALDGSNGFIYKGIAAGDASGISVSDAGDINGDGYDDIVIGASGASPHGTLSGQTYVVFGNSVFAGVNSFANLDGDNGFTLNGIAATDQNGFSVAGGGDFNGDGFSDIITGAYWAASFGAANAGQAYAIWGDSRCEPGEYTLAGSPLCFPVDAGWFYWSRCCRDTIEVCIF
jgi:hypothetical protein